MQKTILTPEEQQYIQIIEDLNKPRGDGLAAGLTTRLHADQIEVLKPLYSGEVNSIFLACGRKYGKTELACYILWRQALLVPNSNCYYICTQNIHAREILWTSNRIQNFLGKDGAKYIKTTRDQAMTIIFHNGSQIRLIGSDNYMVANGLTPHIAVYDEFKGFNPKWHVEFAPNRAAKAAPLVIIGTKPRRNNPNHQQYNSVRKRAQESKSWSYVEKTTWDNPINHLPSQKQIIEEEIADLRARGEEDVVQLEYYSKEVEGGKKNIFPMLRREKHIIDHEKLMRRLHVERHDLDYYIIADPATSSTFGVLFAAINRTSNNIYLVDEIYEKSRKLMSTNPITQRILNRIKNIAPLKDINDDWYKAYDDAGAWFANEAQSQFNHNWFPAQKWKGDKEEGLSLIKDCLLTEGTMFISSKCINLFDEMSAYAVDDKGNIPKINDHLVDCLRYLLIVSNYDFQKITERERKDSDFFDEYDDEEISEEELSKDWTLIFDLLD